MSRDSDEKSVPKGERSGARRLAPGRPVRMRFVGWEPSGLEPRSIVSVRHLVIEREPHFIEPEPHAEPFGFGTDRDHYGWRRRLVVARTDPRFGPAWVRTYHAEGERNRRER